MRGDNYKKTHQEYTEPVAESARGSVIRTFEELKQSLQLGNQLNELRQSQMSNRASNMNNRASPAGQQVGRQSINASRKYQEPNSQYKAATAQPTTEENEKENKVQTKEAFGMMDDHRIPLEELRERYQTDYTKGLSSAKAQQLNEQFGDNKLSEKEREPLWKKFVKEVSNGFAIMLWVGSILCILTYILQPSDPSNMYLGIVLIGVILLTGYITFQQSAKSEALMESFKNFLPQNCTVIRDGAQSQIIALKVVVGDIVMMKAGEKIPADVRILSSIEMKVDNSPLTGETEPLLRTIECSHPENPLEASNLCFFGTLCKEGQGKGVVIRIGDNTTLGQIADLSTADKKVKSPLRQELDRFVIMITIIALGLGVSFFLLAWLLMGYGILQCLIFGIGILVANVPEGLLGCITISLAITAKTLSEKNVLVKNLEAVETLGSTSCICSDKTGTLTQNVMSVEHMWYNDTVIRAKNKSQASPAELEYDESDKGFQNLHYAAMCSSEAIFDLSEVADKEDKESIDFTKVPVMGDATETGLIRFFQYVEDIETTRNRFKVAESKGQLARMPFNSTVKFALTIVEQKTSDSDYCVYMKGAPERIWKYCSNVLVGDRKPEIDQEWNTKFDKVNLRFGKKGERVLGFAKLHLLREEYPLNSTIFNVTSPANFNFKLAGFSFCGLISLIDPPKTRVPNAILECRSAGIKVIMVTGDQPPTAASIARQVNIIPMSVKTIDEIVENEGISWDEAAEKCDAIVVHGDKIVASLEREEEEGKDQFYYLRRWVKKPYCVFARTTPAQKLQIVQACQAEGFVCAVTGDGVNDSPAIKQGDIGISMNITGSDVTKDAADMILLDDDFASIVIGVQEGRKIFDNLKKTVVYLLTSNIPEVIPFLAFIIIQIPLPLSNIFMLCICVGTDILPALSLAYEEAELDIMTRQPRKQTDHLVSAKLITHSYLLMGLISTGAGFTAYYTTLNNFGFTPRALYGMANFSGYTPQSNDFQEYLNLAGNELTLFPEQFTYNTVIYNYLIIQPGYNANKPSCTGINFSSLDYTINWQVDDDAKYDLRKSLIRCNSQGVFETSIPWNLQCDLTNLSPVSGEPVCFSIEALFYAQTSFFVAIVLVQWSNVFACKSRKMSFTTSPVNSVMFLGIIVETVLCIFLFYTPGVQGIFGSRPLEFWQFGIPGLPFSMMLLLWEEFRKFLLRSSKWFNKFCLW